MFRQDLRIRDNPALEAACRRGKPIVPIYLWEPEGEWALGAASRWWLHHSLLSLQEQLQHLGLQLLIADSPIQLLQIARDTNADQVFYNRLYEPSSIQRDEAMKRAFRENGIQSFGFNAALLFEPWEIATKQQTPFKVFTPFWKCCLEKIDNPLPTNADCTPQQSIPPSPTILKTEKGMVDKLQLLPKIHWDQGLQEEWEPGEKGAHSALKKALHSVIAPYPETRDRPDLEGVSKLSPHLHFGEISPRQVWHSVQHCLGPSHPGAIAFLRQLGWREFAYHLLYHFPATPLHPLYKKFELFPWREDTVLFKAWTQGKTGYPFVDAGMRQLWHCGWMHNRVRMIAASFLVKDLLVPWQWGARWFWDTLVDADLANNTMGWQWTAGCGADAAPYFRIFNPHTQGEKFDPNRSYVKKWVPELAGLSDKWIYTPWKAPEKELQKAGIILGKTYPYPIIDHEIARQSALAAFHNLDSN